MTPTLLDDFEGFEPSVEEATADVVETSRELEFGVEPEDGTVPLRLGMKPEQTRSCCSWMSKESGFLKWNLLVEMLGRPLK